MKKFPQILLAGLLVWIFLGRPGLRNAITFVIISGSNRTFSHENDVWVKVWGQTSQLNHGQRSWFHAFSLSFYGPFHYRFKKPKTESHSFPIACWGPFLILVQNWGLKFVAMGIKLSLVHLTICTYWIAGIVDHRYHVSLFFVFQGLIKLLLWN